MSKVAGKLMRSKKPVEKVIHEKIMRVDIPAGLASAGPPLGPHLGQRGINIAHFCKEFNEKTSDIKPGIKIPCRIEVKSDRTYNLVMHSPPASYFLKQAAGCKRGAMGGSQLNAGRISLKHIYEIAKIKSQDPPLNFLPLEQICKMLLGQAISIGIEVVRTIDDLEDYKEFLSKRDERNAAELAALEEVRQAKLLRTGAV